MESFGPAPGQPRDVSTEALLRSLSRIPPTVNSLAFCHIPYFLLSAEETTSKKSPKPVATWTGDPLRQQLVPIVSSIVIIASEK